MKRLEDFIEENREQFEDGHPGRNHEEKFMQLLNEQSGLKTANQFARINAWLKVAAAILIVAGFALGILSVVRNSGGHLQQADTQLPIEIVEMEQYYTSLTREKLTRIETLAGSGPEADKVKSMLNAEIANLNQTSASLKSEYLKGNQDARLVDAIKNNYRIISGLLDKVVEQLSGKEDTSSESVNQHLYTHPYENIIS